MFQYKKHCFLITITQTRAIMYESEHVLFLDASDNEDLDQMIMKDQNMNYWIQDQADTAKATRVKTQVLKTWFQVAKMTRVSRAMKALEDAQAMVDAQAQEKTRIEAIVQVNLGYAIDAVIAQDQGQLDPTKDHMAQTALSNVKSAMADLAHVRSLLVEAQTNVQLVMANAH